MDYGEWCQASAEAKQLVADGRHELAEAIMRSAVAWLGTTAGVGSSQFAQANFELGQLLATIGKQSAAIHAMTIALSVMPTDRAAMRCQAIYATELAELYFAAGKVASGARILRRAEQMPPAAEGEDMVAKRAMDRASLPSKTAAPTRRVDRVASPVLGLGDPAHQPLASLPPTPGSSLQH